jgi:Ca2+-transporting ATPase
MLGMAKVGSDKRINYYQQPVEQVLDEVRSHPYGLTNPEAARRIQHNGFNRLPALSDQNWHKLAVEQAQTPTVLILVGCLALSWYLGAGSTAWTALVAMLLVIGAGVRRELRTTNVTYHLDKYLPEKATVRRNNIETKIDTLELALGDIVLLGPGDIVPADVRLTEADALHIDESLLFGSVGHTRKYTHSLHHSTPLRLRHNVAYQGSVVSTGSGVGVVIASGGQTELGRLLYLARTTASHRSLFSGSFTRLSRVFGLTAVALVVVLAITAKWIGFTQLDGLVSLQTLLAALAPAGIALTATSMFSQFKRLSRRRGVHVESLAAVDRLGQIDAMLLDETGLITGNYPIAQTFLIGKRQFRNQSETYDPKVSLRGPTGRKLGAKTIKELGLFFDAIALSSHATLLTPDNGTNEWRIAGDKTAGALVGLAAQAGWDANEIKSQHALLRDFPHDSDRDLGSAIRSYDHRNLVFVQGDAVSVLRSSVKVWDAGHTRKLSVADQKRFDEFITAQTDIGNAVVAVAYRPLSSKESPEKLTMERAEKGLTLLGLVAVGHPLRHTSVIAVEAARAKGIAVSLLSTANPSSSAAIGVALGFGAKPSVLDDTAVSKLDNAQLAELVSAGDVIFMYLSPEQKLRLIDAAEQSGRRVLASGLSLADLPAMRHASVGASLGRAPALVRSEADIVTIDSDAHALTRAHGRALQAAEHLTESIWAALTNHTTEVWLVLIGFLQLAIWHVPLAITALQLLLCNVVLQLLPAVALGRDKSHRRFSSEESAAQLAYHSHWSSVMLGLIAAVLIATNFLYFFARVGLSPSYIDNSSQLYAQAATIGFATLVLCGWINIVFTRAEKLPLFTSRQLWHNAVLTWSYILSLLVLVGLIYLPTLQRFAGTQSLSAADWLTVLTVAAIYAGVRYVTHAERLHSRHAIVQLHREIHGKHSGAKV